MLGVCLKYTQNNYGSKLQALATVKTFQKLGIDYEIIRYNKKTLHFYIKSLPRFFNFVFLNDRYDEIQKKLELKKHPEVKNNVEIRNHAFDSFDIHFSEHLSEIYASYNVLKSQCSEKYDKTITCSDQLWSPSALGSGFYNLMFVPQDITKISWASSFGVNKIPWYQVKRTKKYLQRIEHISMRENRGAEIVNELTGKNVPVLMDPVFAYDKNEWDAMVEPQKAEWEDYIFCYFLGSNPRHRAAAQELAKKTGLKIVTLRHLDRYVADDEKFGDYAPFDVDPNRFLNILRNATYVCTDSFHGTAFSIIYEKKFIVFDRYANASSNSKNSRIDSVCSNLGVEDRRFNEKADITELMENEIDYKGVQEKLLPFSEHTFRYLKNALDLKD